MTFFDLESTLVDDLCVGDRIIQPRTTELLTIKMKERTRTEDRSNRWWLLGFAEDPRTVEAHAGDRVDRVKGEH